MLNMLSPTITDIALYKHTYNSCYCYYEATVYRSIKQYIGESLPAILEKSGNSVSSGKWLSWSRSGTIVLFYLS